MGARFNRQDVVLGALPVGTPVPEDVIDVIVASEGLPNEPFDWDVLPPGTTGQVLTVNADGSIGWAAGGGGGSGTVTSVSFTGDGTVLSSTPSTAVTASGTVTAALTTQAKNIVLAGPTTGSNAAPTFRALAAADLPTGTGTVTSVSWTGDGTIFTASADTPVTTSGTLTPASLIAQTKNTLLAGPTTGSNVAPTFRALGQADLTSASPISSPGSGVGSEQFGASSNTATNTNSIAISHGANGTSNNCTAIGYGATVTYTSGGIAIGYGATLNNSTNGMAIGTSSNVNNYNCSIALGNSAIATAVNQLVIGSTNAYINTVNVIGGTSGSTLNLEGYSTTTERPCGIISSSFNTSTDASWSGNLSLYAGDYTSSNAGKRLGVQIQSNGSAALLGLFGVTPVVQPVGGGGNTSMTVNTGTAVLAGSTFTGASGSSTYTIGDIVTALKAIGALAP